MKQKILLTSLVIVGFGCQGVPFGGDARWVHGGSAMNDVPPSEEGADDETDVPIVGFSAMGEVVVFDGLTGAMESSVPGGGGTPRDVAMDPWRKGVWVFEENADASGGEIRFCPLEKEFGAKKAHALLTELRPCEHAVWVDGLAVMLPMEDGLWVFEDGIGGARWKVLRSGAIGTSTSAPRPMSITVQNAEIAAFSMGFQNDQLLLLHGDFGSSGPEVTQEYDWGQPLGYPPTSRYAWLTYDAGLLFDAVGKALTVRRVKGGEMGVPMVLDVGVSVERIEAAVGVGASAVVLGKDALWIVEARDTGIELMSGLWLHGDVRESPQFFSRDLLVTENRAFVGTDRAVRAVGLENNGEVVTNAFLDEEFVGEGLRGPLDKVRAAQ